MTTRSAPARLGSLVAAVALLVVGCATSGPRSTPVGSSAGAGASTRASLTSVVADLPAGSTASSPEPSNAQPSNDQPSNARPSTPAASGPSYDGTTRPPLGTPTRPVRVSASGMVLVDQQQHAVLCAPYWEAAAGVVGTTGTPATPPCPSAIALVGVDAGRLADVGRNATDHWGAASISGEWDGTRIRVALQGPPEPGSTDSFTLDQHVPCAAPAGGWKIGPTQTEAGVSQIVAAVGPDVGALGMSYVRPLAEVGNSLDHAQQVVVVGTTGDRAGATAAVRRVFTGNLCVVKAAHSQREVDAQQSTLHARLTAAAMRRLGVTTSGVSEAPLGTPISIIEVAVDSAALRAIVDAIPGPPIGIYPWLRVSG